MKDVKMGDLDSKARAQVRSGIRKAFKFTKAKEYLHAARVEVPRLTKTGKIGILPEVFIQCNSCKILWKEKQIHIDHIEPVVPLNRQEIDMTVGEYAYNTFYNKCQTLCKFCHRGKTNEENIQRKINKKKKQDC